MPILDYIRCLWQGQALARTLRSLPKAAPFRVRWAASRLQR
jgi:hypothetical protein